MKKGTWVTIIIILLIIGLAIFYIRKTPATPLTPGNETDFVKCVAEKATLYMQTECYACQQQEKLFGKSYDYLKKINCTDDMTECYKQGITQRPTWIIGYDKYIGYKTLEQLSKLTGCELK